MKKVISVLVLVCILLSAAGCDPASLSEPTEAVFSIESYRLRITADSTFRQNTGGSFDLQITNGKAYISVMAYRYADIPADTTPMDVYEIQNEDLFSRRTAVTVIEEPETQTLAQQVMTRALYSAQKDGVENDYATYLMDLPGEETFAWVLVTATPTYFESNREYLHGIVCSLTADK